MCVGRTPRIEAPEPAPPPPPPPPPAPAPIPLQPAVDPNEGASSVPGSTRRRSGRAALRIDRTRSGPSGGGSGLNIPR